MVGESASGVNEGLIFGSLAQQRMSQRVSQGDGVMEFSFYLTDTGIQ